MLEEILSVLRTNFSQYPPHTIQRLAELILEPRRHYRNVVPYLHALDRVVHVTSGANTYPLPPLVPEMGAMSLSSGAGAASNIGSDEALGGALLTPIPWLAKRANGGGSDAGSNAGASSPLSSSGEGSQQFQFQQQGQATHLDGRVRTESTETIEGPHGMGSIETVSVSVNGIPSTGAGAALLSQRPVTQGELLRQEQRAGVIPFNQLNREQQQQQQQQHTPGNANPSADEDTAMGDGAADEEEEVPHARGPGEIGPADTGRVASYMTSPPMDPRTIDVEAAVGRRAQHDETKDAESRSTPEALVPPSPKREAPDDLAEEHGRKRLKDDNEPSPSSTEQQQQQQPQNQKQPAADEMDAALTATASEPDPNQDAKTKTTADAEGDLTLPDGPSTSLPEPSSQPTSKDSGKTKEASPKKQDDDDPPQQFTTKPTTVTVTVLGGNGAEASTATTKEPGTGTGSESNAGNERDA